MTPITVSVVRVSKSLDDIFNRALNERAGFVKSVEEAARRVHKQTHSEEDLALITEHGVSTVEVEGRGQKPVVRVVLSESLASVKAAIKRAKKRYSADSYRSVAALADLMLLQLLDALMGKATEQSSLVVKMDHFTEELRELSLAPLFAGEVFEQALAGTAPSLPEGVKLAMRYPQSRYVNLLITKYMKDTKKPGQLVKYRVEGSVKLTLCELLDQYIRRMAQYMLFISGAGTINETHFAAAVRCLLNDGRTPRYEITETQGVRTLTETQAKAMKERGEAFDEVSEEVLAEWEADKMRAKEEKRRAPPKPKPSVSELAIEQSMVYDSDVETVLMQVADLVEQQRAYKPKKATEEEGEEQGESQDEGQEE